MALTRNLFVFLLLLSPVLPTVAANPGKARKTEPSTAGPLGGHHPILWLNPADIGSRNLFLGPGGQKHQPQQGMFSFLKEDLNGTNPKFDVKDSADVKWKVKMGAEARPETAASRLIWAAGYFADDDYFLDSLHVEDLPAHLKRGQKLVHNGTVVNVRLKRENAKKFGTWAWKEYPFTGTRELNGLRLMMALINNWDVKDENNAIYEADNGDRVYLVSDLGASFGTAGADWPLTKSKGNLKSYAHSKFLTRVTPEFVEFKEPARPALIWLVHPGDFFRRLDLEWIGKQIPRADAKWMGGLLSQLSSTQIHDAFRAAGYTPQQADGFAAVVEKRIAALKAL